MRHCPACNALCNDNDTHCPDCGAELFKIPEGKILCTKCGTQNNENNAMCEKCGNVLHAATIPGQQTFEDVNKVNVRVCPVCDRENNAEAVFCNFCGKNMNNPTASSGGLRERIYNKNNKSGSEIAMTRDPKLSNAEKPTISKRTFMIIVAAAAVLVILAGVIAGAVIGSKNKNFNGKTLADASEFLSKKKIPYEVVINETPAYSLDKEPAVVSFSSVTGESQLSDKFNKKADKIILYVQSAYVDTVSVERNSAGNVFVTFKNNYTSMLTNVDLQIKKVEEDKTLSTAYTAAQGCYCAPGNTALVCVNCTEPTSPLAFCEITFTFADGTTQKLSGEKVYSSADIGTCNETIPVTNSGEDETKISLDNNIKADNCKDGECSFKGIVKTSTGSSLNMRSSASLNADKVSSIPNGTIVAFSKIENGFGYCTYGGKTGWAKLDYIEASYRCVSDTDILASAAADAAKTGTLAAGTSITVDSIENGYVKTAQGYILLSSLSSNY